MKHKTPLPRRKLDAPWIVSQDVAPPPDATWLQYLADGEDFQMPPYPWQYVQNEILLPVRWSDCGRSSYHINVFQVGKIPVFPGSLCGTIYKESTAIQVFWIRESGEIKLDKLGDPGEIFVEYLAFVNLTGQLELKWNGRPGHNHIIASYEYEYYSSVETNEQSTTPRYA